MKTKLVTYRVTILAVLMIMVKVVGAQLYISNTDFATRPNALVYVNGDVQYDGGGIQLVDHHGLWEIKGNWYNTSGSDLKVFNDASNGVVLLSGGLQTFNGRNTRFPNLTLTGTAKKQQNTSIEVKDILDLTNVELDVNGNVAGILSSDKGAVMFEQGGYVNTSANNKGWLARNMTKGESYIFPLGNNDGFRYRFRPLVVTAQNAGNIYGQFQNYNSAKDNFATSFKARDVNRVNDYWYHALVTNASSNNVVVEVPENSIVDGQYTTMVKWDATKNEWQRLASVGPTPTGAFATNDNVFKTKATVALTNARQVPINLATENIEEFKIPNVITPNGDAYNQRWVITGIDPMAKMEVVIFNRWNNVVYENKNYDNSWEGKGLNAGTYYYVLKVILPSGEEKTYKGFIMLM